jgi:hypothetical protein
MDVDVITIVIRYGKHLETPSVQVFQGIIGQAASNGLRNPTARPYPMARLATRDDV